MMIVAMSDGLGYLQRSHLDDIANYHMEIYAQLYHQTAILVDNIYEFMEAKRQHFNKINIYQGTADKRDQLYDRLALENITMIKAEESGLELTAAGVEKGQGLLCLSQEVAIPLSQIIAVGDANNDESMLHKAGLGLAMGNANTKIKSLADVVLKDNDSDGCAQAIDDYLLADNKL